MQIGRPIELNGKPVADGKMPLICTPLVGRSADGILSELNLILPKKPDILEWRVDFFEDIADIDKVLDLAARIKDATRELPLLFTRRSAKEGGEKIAISEEEVVALYRAVCASRAADLVDFEMSNEPEQVRRVREAAHANGVKLILSYHDFKRTPSLDAINRRFLDAQRLGGDIGKVAVMPRNPEQVLTLLSATLHSSQALEIPLISMSMGAYGSLTRLFGWAFGSALTFAIGESSSAPGQVPIEDLNTVLGILKKSMSGR